MEIIVILAAIVLFSTLAGHFGTDSRRLSDRATYRDRIL